MGLFSSKKASARSVVLVDIGSVSVGGAYARLEAGKPPRVIYTARVNVEPREGESIEEAMLRSLTFLEKLLIEEGAPALRRDTKSGTVDEVLVSVGAPWQQTKIVTKQIQRDKEFVFTRSLMHEATEAVAAAGKGRIESGRTIIATVLNGYETANPFNKKAKRAEIVVLSSSLEEKTANAIEESLRHTFHMNDVRLTAFGPVAYAVFRDLYPHQKEFIVLDVSGADTDAAFVKRGLLASVASVPLGIRDLVRTPDLARSAHELSENPAVPFTAAIGSSEAKWLAGLREIFAGFASTQALPRTVFLITSPDTRDYLKRTLEGSELRTLWLSDEPLSVVAVAPSHLSAQVTSQGLAEGDLHLGLLALFCGKEDRAHEAKA